MIGDDRVDSVERMQPARQDKPGLALEWNGCALKLKSRSRDEREHRRPGSPEAGTPLPGWKRFEEMVEK